MVAFFSEPRKESAAVSAGVTESEVQETVAVPVKKLENQVSIMHEVISNQAGAPQRNIEGLRSGVEKLLIASQEFVAIMHPEASNALDKSAQNSEEASQSYTSGMSP